MIYQTQQNETLDNICFKHYGHTQNTVEPVLAVNPGLAELGPILPPGIDMHLPNILNQTPTKPTVKLWD